jgi:tRNA G18 (ribose-2'-O)-methylase SpoU
MLLSDANELLIFPLRTNPPSFSFVPPPLSKQPTGKGKKRREREKAKEAEGGEAAGAAPAATEDGRSPALITKGEFTANAVCCLALTVPLALAQNREFLAELGERAGIDAPADDGAVDPSTYALAMVDVPEELATIAQARLQRAEWVRLAAAQLNLFTRATDLPALLSTSSTLEPPSLTLPRLYLIVYCMTKRANVGTLLRSAAAFGVTKVFLVGAARFGDFGAHGAVNFLKLEHFPTAAVAKATLVERGIRIVGVEIDPSARHVADPSAFADADGKMGDVAVMLGEEGNGMTPAQFEMCDSLVYIPHHGDGTASLNVSVAGSIVMHHFAMHAGFPERPRVGGKFLVGERPFRTWSKKGGIPTSKDVAVLPTTESQTVDTAGDETK